MTDLETHEYLTVKELADLLRIKERKVYDLAASGKVPCSRAMGKLLFPAADIRAWIDDAKSGGEREIERPNIFLGSHDPLLDWAIRQSRCGLATFFDGSLDGLGKFQSGGGVASSLHIFDADAKSWNVTEAAQFAADQNAALVTFATRRRGLVFRSESARPASIADLRGLLIAPRQEGSGTAKLFDSLARQGGFAQADARYTDVARTEDEAAQLVRSGEADVTFGLQPVADTYGLDFVPLIEERFDILIERKAWFEPPLQTLFGFCRTEAFLNRAHSQPGYDVSQLGQVVWNA